MVEMGWWKWGHGGNGVSHHLLDGGNGGNGVSHHLLVHMIVV